MGKREFTRLAPYLPLDHWTKFYHALSVETDVVDVRQRSVSNHKILTEDDLGYRRYCAHHCTHGIK